MTQIENHGVLSFSDIKGFSLSSHMDSALIIIYNG